MRAMLVASVAVASCTLGLQAQSYSLRTDWSETQNPNGVWSYCHGATPLPHVASWQRNLGGWSQAQPGWALSEDGNNRLPFWFRSNGSETFGNDFEPGDIVVHTTDGANGVGSGPANVRWTAPAYGMVTFSGGVWMGRDIGRSNNWTFYRGGTALTSGSIFSGDAYNREHPLDLSDGSGGAAPLTEITVCGGEEFRLEFTATGNSGDFVGVEILVDFIVIDCPSDWNGDDCVSSQDFFDFLVNFFAGKADFNNDGATNSQDFFDFLVAFFAGCE